MVLTVEFATAWRARLSQLPNVQIAAYSTSNEGEMGLRQQLRETQREVGLKSVLDIFGIPRHSHPLLQNTEVHNQIQARTDMLVSDLVANSQHACLVQM